MAIISIIMPMKNAATYVTDSVDSVLSQKHVDIELIVVDDGSTDDSKDKVEKFGDKRIILLSNKGAGIPAALNRGFEFTNSKYVARCDADDLYGSNRLKRQVDFLESHYNYGAVCGSYGIIDETGLDRVPRDTGDADQEITNELRQGHTRTHFGSFLLRSEVFRNIGGFRPFFITSEDIDFQCRLGHYTKVWYENRTNYWYRINQKSITHNQSTQKRIFYENLARSLSKERLHSGTDCLELGKLPELPKQKGKAKGQANQQMAKLLRDYSWRLHAQGEKKQAISIAWRAIQYNPKSSLLWRSLIAVVRKNAI